MHEEPLFLEEQRLFTLVRLELAADSVERCSDVVHQIINVLEANGESNNSRSGLRFGGNRAMSERCWMLHKSIDAAERHRMGDEFYRLGELRRGVVTASEIERDE